MAKRKKVVSRITMDTCLIGDRVQRSVTISRGPTHKADRRVYYNVRPSTWRRWRAIQDAM